MHELALMESVVAEIGERLGDVRVSTVRLEIGRLAGVVPEALRFCFDVCTRGTSMEGASLEIAELPGRGRCGLCGGDRVVDSFVAICPCGGELMVVGGEELRLKNVEVV
jgi:hydrogenase nickel incorporation protein HypA/HybF